jgi:LacI family transcriptional regulator
MPDVAEAAGVSLKTVSRVVNGEANVAPETSARVLEAIGRLGFTRNDIARGLRSRQTSSSLGLIIEDLGNPFYSSIARAVEAAAEESGFMLVVASSEGDDDRERRLVAALVERRVDGLLLVPSSEDHRYLAAEAARTPVVFLDRPPHGVRSDAVLLDNAGGARLAAQRLLGQGHARIAVVGGPAGLYTMRERVSGFRAAMADAGTPVDESLLRLDAGTPDAAAAATAELFASRRGTPTALFCLNNRAAVGAVRALAYRARPPRRPPAMVAFDDFELAGVLPWPIAVVAHDTAAMGRLAAGLLLERIGGSRARPKQVTVPTRLVAPAG